MQKIITENGINITESNNDRFFKQNGVLMALHTIPVLVKKLFTDNMGTIINKNVALPSNLRVEVPVYLFGEFDRQGAYQAMQKIATPYNWQFLQTFVHGVSTPFLFATGLNDIKNHINPGDIILVYTDNKENPTYYCWIVITCLTVSLASICGNTESTQRDNRIGALYIKEANLKVDPVAQFYKPLYYVAYDNIGNYRFDTVQPNMFLTPFNQQRGFITLNVHYRLDQYLGICFNMLHDSDQVALDFIVKQV